MSGGTSKATVPYAIVPSLDSTGAFGSANGLVALSTWSSLETFVTAWLTVLSSGCRVLPDGEWKTSCPTYVLWLGKPFSRRSVPCWDALPGTV